MWGARICEGLRRGEHNIIIIVALIIIFLPANDLIIVIVIITITIITASVRDSIEVRTI